MLWVQYYNFSLGIYVSLYLINLTSACFSSAVKIVSGLDLNFVFDLVNVNITLLSGTPNVMTARQMDPCLSCTNTIAISLICLEFSRFFSFPKPEKNRSPITDHYVFQLLTTHVSYWKY